MSCDLMGVFTLHVGISTYEITVEHRLRDHVVALAGRLCFGPRFLALPFHAPLLLSSSSRL